MNSTSIAMFLVFIVMELGFIAIETK